MRHSSWPFVLVLVIPIGIAMVVASQLRIWLWT
jgi:hypothetical protein